MLELHNFEWEEERLVQVETQPHHLAGILGSIQDTLNHSDCDWEGILSAYYECEDDSTVTFYESEGVDAGNPGIWTYVVYECAAGEENVLTAADINTLNPVLQLQEMLSA